MLRPWLRRKHEQNNSQNDITLSPSHTLRRSSGRARSLAVVRMEKSVKMLIRQPLLKVEGGTARPLESQEVQKVGSPSMRSLFKPPSARRISVSPYPVNAEWTGERQWISYHQKKMPPQEKS
ncbi:hypothetical protein BHE74_00046209 [Ensete ventricosum]|nr:hypothetical protein GW17_00045760 [Ensete ventricosum]RWW47766.1 hypothetical protein BHE74_00046209 [Ensete ventricosum]